MFPHLRTLRPRSLWPSGEPSKTLQSAKYLVFTVLKIFSENFWVQVQPNKIEAKPMRPHDQHAPSLALGPKNEEEEEEEHVKREQKG